MHFPDITFCMLIQMWHDCVSKFQVDSNQLFVCVITWHWQVIRPYWNALAESKSWPQFTGTVDLDVATNVFTTVWVSEAIISASYIQQVSDLTRSDWHNIYICFENIIFNRFKGTNIWRTSLDVLGQCRCGPHWRQIITSPNYNSCWKYQYRQSHF